MKMRVPAVLSVRDLGRGHCAHDPPLHRSPLPALPKALLGALHRLDLVRQPVPDAVPSGQRDHDRDQAALSRPRQQAIQFAAPRLADPPPTARA